MWMTYKKFIPNKASVFFFFSVLAVNFAKSVDWLPSTLLLLFWFFVRAYRIIVGGDRMVSRDGCVDPFNHLLPVLKHMLGRRSATKKFFLAATRTPMHVRWFLGGNQRGTADFLSSDRRECQLIFLNLKTRDWKTMKKSKQTEEHLARDFRIFLVGLCLARNCRRTRKLSMTMVIVFACFFCQFVISILRWNVSTTNRTKEKHWFLQKFAYGYEWKWKRWSDEGVFLQKTWDGCCCCCCCFRRSCQSRLNLAVWSFRCFDSCDSFSSSLAAIFATAAPRSHDSETKRRFNRTWLISMDV